MYSSPANRGKRDGNAAEIADALTRAGCSVIDLGTVGDGTPDLLIGYAGCCFLLEVKMPDATKRRSPGPVPHYELMTDSQISFLASWKGCKVRIVTSVEEALAELGLAPRATGGGE